MTYFKFGIYVALLSSVPALAIGISEETQYGLTVFSQSLSVDGEVGGDEKADIDAPWDWSAEYMKTRTTSSDTSGNPLIDNTSEYTLTGGWIGPSGWGTNLSLVFSHTPEESLSSRGGTITPSYRWQYLGQESTDDSFQPYIDFKLDAESIDFLEDFSGQIFRNKKFRPVSGISELRQNSLGPNFAWRPNKGWKFSAGVVFYFYNRDVNQFQNQLDSPQALRMGVAGFSNTVGGLAKDAYNGGIDWYFSDDWKASLTETFSVIAADSSTSTSLKGGCAYKISKSWRVTGSGEWDNSTLGSDFIGILNIGWDSL